MHETILFVVNPIAGGIDKAATLDLIHTWAQGSDNSIEVYETTGKNDKEQLRAIIKKNRPAKVVSVGGDGTVLLCADLLRYSETPLGIIPMGSANGMATELGIPRGLEAQLRIIDGGQIKAIDVLSFNDDEDFGIHISDIGMNARLVKYFEESERRGFLGYAEGVLQEYIRPESFKARFTADDEEYEMNCLMLAFANAKRYGTGASLNSVGKLNDGLMEICALQKLEFSHLVSHWFDIVDENSDHMKVIQCKKAEIELNRPVAFQVDGELKKPCQKLKVEVIPQALKLITP